MKNSLPAYLRKATPAAVLLGLTLILTGCTADQDNQDDQLFPSIHSASYGQSAVALPQDLRHHQRAPRTAQFRHHAAPPAEVLPTGY